MKIHKSIGSKERFLEMFQGVNKIQMNEVAMNTMQTGTQLVEKAFEELATGTLVVTPLNDDIYRIEFDGTTDAGSSVTIFFEQPIQIID